MKSIKQLFEVVALAVQKNSDDSKNKYCSHWFIDYSGHTNKLAIQYFPYGWQNGDGVYERFIKSRLANGLN